MRKCKFITGTMSLTLAMAVGVTSFAQVSGQVPKEAFVCEYETNTSEPEIEKSANEIDILMAAAIIEKTTAVSMELETSVTAIDHLVVNMSEGDGILKNIKAESESKKIVEKTSKKVSEKKNKKKKKKNNSKKKTNKKKKENDSLVYMGNYKITAYCACSKCCGVSTGITASGTKATAGRTIAADTSVLPFGTQVVIDGHTYTVEDRGGAIQGNKIDIFFNSHSEALNWGVRYFDVYVQK